VNQVGGEQLGMLDLYQVNASRAEGSTIIVSGRLPINKDAPCRVFEYVPAMTLIVIVGPRGHACLCDVKC
jgi:hypothetical protein